MANNERPPSQPSIERWQEVDAIVHRFEEAWRQGGSPPEIDDYLPQDGPESLRLEVLEDLVYADQHCRQANESVTREEYLQRYPQLRTRMANRETAPRESTPTGDATPVDLTPPFEMGNYHIESKIENGGMGVVYRATHAYLKKPVAFKILRPEYMADPHAVARFRREIMAIGKLDHNNIVRATDAHIGAEGGVHYLVMDLIDGIDLSKVVRLHGPLSVADACAVVLQAANGLQCAHEHKFVHRDIKPSNLLLSVKGELKILDLGLALLSEGKTPESTLTVSGQVMGTADYMAPEQWEASHTVDIRADIYSLGFTLYTLLAGQPPFAGPEFKSIPQKMAAHFRSAVGPIADQRPDVPAPIANLVARMMSKKPEDRPSSPDEVAIDLQPFAASADLAGLARRTMALRCNKVPESLLVANSVTASRPGSGGESTLGPQRTPRRRVPFSRKSRLAALLGLGTVVIAIGSLFALKQPEQVLLDQVPVEIKFPPGRLSRWEIKGKGRQRELWVHADGESVLQLGEAKTTSYEIETTMEQFRWGSAGLFFGLHDDVYKGQPCKNYQRITIASRADRYFIDHYCVRQLDKRKVFTAAGKPIPIALPTRRGHTLKVTVSNSGIWRIFWNGLEVGPIPDPNYPLLQSASLVGGFGVYNELSECVYRDTKFRTFTVEESK